MSPQNPQHRPPLVRLYDGEIAVDLFAGGGGASTGIEKALGHSPFLAINHDREALAMHNANHPLTFHLREDVRDVNPKKHPKLKGKKIGLAWFSPDCTFFSKAKGGVPFRDPERARRIRGLIGIVLRWAEAKRPRVLFIENVEEIKDWCPINRKTGRPDMAQRGSSFRRWLSRLRRMGYVVEFRELVCANHGDPTKRKRLFIIARCDGKPIVWPAPSHGPLSKEKRKHRTAAEGIDFTIPVPSIFLTPAQSKQWAKANGLAKSQAPRRPLAPATLRRVARGVDRFVVTEKDPFIIPVTHPRDARCHSVHEPLRTITSSERGEFAVVQPTMMPFLAGVGGRKSQSNETPVNQPYHTSTAKADTVLVTPTLAPFIVPSLISTGNGERHGVHGEQAPRVMDVQEPFKTVTATGSQGALVAAFLAKHNAGNEATGQLMTKPCDTITTRDSKAVVTSHLLKFRGNEKQGHDVTGQGVLFPLDTITAGGTHHAEVRVTLVPKDSLDPSYVETAVKTCAFLVKYFGTGVARSVDEPTGALTTKDRLGLVTVMLVRVKGDEFIIADIGMRMLTPRELFNCQGFPKDYRIDHGIDIETRAMVKLTKKAQTRLVGNSVPPNTAAALIAANMERAS